MKTIVTVCKLYLYVYTSVREDSIQVKEKLDVRPLADVYRENIQLSVKLMNAIHGK